MRILAYDIATKTGWCLGELGDTRPVFGLHTFPSSGEDLGPYLDAAEKTFDADIAKWMPDLLCFEAPILPMTTRLETVRKLSALAALVELVCYRRRIKCREISNSAVKRFAVGNGRAKKHEVIAAIQAFGFSVDQTDIADAIALWMTAQSRIDLEQTRSILRRWDQGVGLFASA